jgi:hypothetical protein
VQLEVRKKEKGIRARLRMERQIGQKKGTEKEWEPGKEI